MLSDQEQKVYQQICENVNALKSTFSLEEAITVKQLEQVLLAVYNDHPEFFWLDTNYKYEYNPSGVVLMVTLQFNETVDTIIDKKDLFEKRSQEIIESIQEESDEYKKELLLYNKLLNEITYDRDAENNQSAYSAIVNGRTVCAGYARAFQYLMCRMGIPTYYCTGITNENHAWNIVKLSDGYYNVDVTWDDSEQGRYLYFNKSDIDFSKDHQRKELSINLPSCSGEKYRYY